MTMNWFQFDFEVPDWVQEDLEDRVIRHKEDFSKHLKFPYKLIGTRNVLEKTGGVKWLYDNVPITPVTDCILFIPENQTTGWHVDGNSESERKTVLTFPLFANENYAPTFFENETVEYKGKPVFLNTQVPHCVETTTDRFCFQLCFDRRIDEIFHCLTVS